MPFRIIKQGDNFALFNIHKKRLVQKTFRSKEGAIGFAQNAIRFREKKNSKVVGNKILPI